MNHLISIILLFCVISTASFSQTDQQSINDLNEISSGGHQQMMGKSLPPPEIKGSTYYSDHWFQGKILLENGKKVEGLSIKYDIADGLLVTKKDERKLAYKSEDILEFQWFNRYTGQVSDFKNCKGYKLSGTELTGFFEVIVNDKVSFFTYPTIHIKKPDYVEGLDVGNRDYQIRKSEDYYFAFSDELLEIKKSNSKNLKILAKGYPSLKDFVKSKKLSFKDKNDLILITEFINTANSQGSNF